MSVFKRPGSPYYYTEFKVGSRRFLRSTRTTTEREARAEERRLKAHYLEQAKERNPNGGLSLTQAFGKYWKDHGHKLRWAEAVKRYCDQILRVVGEHIPMEEVSDAEVDRFVIARQKAGIGPYSINRAIAVWRRIHRMAKRRWKMKVQEIDWSQFTSPEEKRVAKATVEQIRTLIANVPERLGFAIEWSVYTGTRKAATKNLRRDQIDVMARTATIVKKGGKLQVLRLSDQTLDLLARVPVTGPYVFDMRNYRKLFKAACEKAGLTNFRWHDLRHVHATWLRQAGVKIEVVQRSLGHEQLATTMRYAHVADDEVQEAVQKLPSLSTSTPKIVSIKSLK